VVILGKAGALLKKLTSEAAKDLEEIFQRKVYLNLMVQEKKNYESYDET
jgi:GTPase Era involved in 16S rRNA processing